MDEFNSLLNIIKKLFPNAGLDTRIYLRIIKLGISITKVSQVGR